MIFLALWKDCFVVVPPPRNDVQLQSQEASTSSRGANSNIFLQTEYQSDDVIFLAIWKDYFVGVPPPRNDEIIDRHREKQARHHEEPIQIFSIKLNIKATK